MGKSLLKKRAFAVSLAGGDDESARGRLLSAATRLFCKNGINATGIDAIIDKAGSVGEHDKDQKQLRAIAMRHKKLVLSHIEGLASEMGAAEPEVVAHLRALLMDGAIVAAMGRDPKVADTAGLAAGSLFGPSRLKRPKRAGNAGAQLVAV
jgi:hypothetical protein